MIYDVIIIGGGPAGLTAALYSDRAGLKTLILEKYLVGGQVITTYEIENYPGYLNISGPDLIDKMEEQIKHLNIPLKIEEVKDIDIDSKIKKVVTTENTYECKTIILATGANPKMLGTKGENEFRGKGVSYCATCDGGFFRKKIVVVVGGGNTAVEDAIFLSRMCEKVYVVHRRDQFRAGRKLVNKMLEIDNIEIVYDTIVEEIYGDNLVKGVKIKNTKNGETESIETNGVFIAVGIKANNQLIEGKLETDEFGFAKTNENLSTAKEGVFIAGDSRVSALKQIVIAAAEGAIASYSASLYIAEND